MATDLRQTHFRFGNDDGTESGHTFKAAEDVNVSLFAGVNFLLRFVVQESGGTAAANTDFQFRYNKNGAGWNNITTTSSVIKAVAVGAFANGANCTKRLTSSGTFETSGAGCTEDGTSGGTANDIAASGASETECGLQIVSADVARGDTIQISLSSPDFAITLTTTPSITVLGNLSLPIASGALSVSGTSVGLKATRKLAVSSGAFSLTGSAVSLVKASGLTHYVLSIASGTVALSGTGLSLKYGRKIAISAGNFSLSGSVLSLRASRRLSVAAGAFLLSGVPIGLMCDRVISLASGLFAISGSGFTLKTDRKLAIASGSFSLTGTAVSLIKAGGLTHYVLSITSGSVVLIGAGLSLKAARKMAVSPGNFFITGTALELLEARGLPHYARHSPFISGYPSSKAGARRFWGVSDRPPRRRKR